MSKTARRDTIDKDWVDQVRKTWKKQVAKSKSIKTLTDAEDYLRGIATWIRALGHDMAFAKGFFVFLPEKGKSSLAQGMKLKAMKELESVEERLKEGRADLKFWREVMTPGTRTYQYGAGHRYTFVRDAAVTVGKASTILSSKDADAFVEQNPQVIERELGVLARAEAITAVRGADAIFSRKFLGHLTRIQNKWKSNIEWGATEREFSIGNVKVVMIDLPSPWAEPRGNHRSPFLAQDYIPEFKKAEALLKAKGLGFLWYGTMFVSCRGCGGDNQLGKHFGVGAHYFPSKDTVKIYQDPIPGLHRLIAHELGHRYYYKFMSATDRARFDSWFGDVAAVSSYGGTVSKEDFAEVFSYYVDNRDLTRDQLDRFKQFLQKGKRASASRVAIRHLRRRGLPALDRGCR